MVRRKVSRNAPCPCGSGKKYKQCCLRKDFDWVEDDDGGLFKAIPMSSELADLLEEQRQAYLGRRLTWRLDGVDIVPPVAFERILHYRFSHHEEHLSFRHARFQLVYHFLRDDVALLNGDPVDLGNADPPDCASRKREGHHH